MHDPENDVEFFFLRPRDIAIYVGEGTLDVGITGRDMLLDSGANADEILTLGFAPSTFRLAAPTGMATVPADLDGRTIATSYAGLLEAYLEREGISARVVKLDGAVENAVALGVADAVADVVATGTTLRKAGLELVGEPILVSEAARGPPPRGVRRCRRSRRSCGACTASWSPAPTCSSTTTSSPSTSSRPAP